MDLKQQISLGEDSRRQFKADVHNADSLAAEMAAFANSEGGTIFIGVADDGSMPGLSGQDVSRINPILASFVAKNLLPYRGLGSGIRRALAVWPDIDFVDDRDGCTFIAIVRRLTGHQVQNDAPVKTNKGATWALKAHLGGGDAPLNDFQLQLLELIRRTPTISYNELSIITDKDRSTIMRNINKLKKAGLLRRIGSKKTGHWEVSHYFGEHDETRR